ncbi:PIG-L family deacetylase [uncultured Selenomonas sp.]|uniref:PIG-L deacetylase family protein n=1 Tax=uncultured Selenomonas sp. TaxID=159275 RepID=UPI0025E7332F|nr:PIG-L family deacetylase [uncultured Selenomonas sp.]
MKKKILVVAAHPDDEVLGVGGTILRHVAEGDEVRILLLAEGVTSRADTRDEALCHEALDALHTNAQRVAKALGAKCAELCNFPDNRMDSMMLLDVVKPIEHVINMYRPDVVYTHHGGDVNVDHQRTHEAVVTACRALPGQCVHELYFFETPSSTEWQMMRAERAFLPTLYVDIAATLAKKLDVLHLYDSEMRSFPHTRSYEAVEALAQWRGATAGVAAAEAFEVGRVVRTTAQNGYLSTRGGADGLGRLSSMGDSHRSAFLAA